MFSLLFDTSFYYDILIAIGIIAIIYLCAKYKNLQVYVFTIGMIVCLCTAGYCGIRLNNYYSASGGIYGVISDQIHQSNKIEVEELKFSFVNTMMTQEHDDVYSATIYSNQIVKLESGQTYGVYVNDSPCYYVDPATDYLFANYEYNFYNNEKSLLLNDTLKMAFSFANNITEIKVTTEGGSDAVKYWNEYFNKNNFVVTIKAVNEFYSNTYDVVEESEYLSVIYLNNGEIYKQAFYTAGETIEQPILPSYDGGTEIKYGTTYDITYVFRGWSLDGTNLITEDYTISENITLNAVFYKTTSANLDSPNKPM